MFNSRKLAQDGRINFSNPIIMSPKKEKIDKAKQLA